MQKIKLVSLLITTVLLIGACTQKNADNPPAHMEESNTSGEEIMKGNEESSAKVVDEQALVNIPMSDFFLPSGSKAHYEGEGNEFAELDIEVTSLDNNYVIVDENNGGALIRTIYHVQENTIEIVFSEAIDFNEPMPSPKEISIMDALEVYLQKPFEAGTAFGDWSIIETNVTVKTPFKTFNNAIVVEMQDDDFINRKYFVQSFGEVKRESIMKTEAGDEFIITSTLESIE